MTELPVDAVSLRDTIGKDVRMSLDLATRDIVMKGTLTGVDWNDDGSPERLNMLTAGMIWSVRWAVLTMVWVDAGQNGLSDPPPSV